MKDIILVDGDIVMFDPLFGINVVTVMGPVKITATGLPKIGGKGVCLMGDHLAVSANCTYMNPAFSIPGTGKLTIVSLLPPQILPLINSSGKPIMVKGQKFMALFTMQSPAKMPGPPPVPDAVAAVPGTGMFIPSQFQVMGG